MRKLTTSLSLLTLLAPAAAWAQDADLADAADEAPLSDAETTEAESAEPPDAAAGVDANAETSLAAGTSGTSTATVAAPAPTPPPPVSPATESAPVAATQTVAAPKATTTRSGAASGDWGFSYSGYFRAPLNMGIGNNTSPAHRQDALELAGSDVNPEGQVLIRDEDGNWNGQVQPKQYSLHLPVIPDNQYPSWQFTAHNRNDWAEMFFSVGNSMVSGTLAIQAFQYTDSTWELSAGQFGIGQGWIEVDHDLGLDNFNFNAKVGAHWGRYGTAGIYDAGEYDTYLFGRTHTAGLTLRTDFILPSFDLGIEAGFGAKVPNPKQSNRARFTTVAHGHVFFTFPAVEFSLNAMHAWSAQEAVPQFNNHFEGSSGCDYDGAYGAQCTIHDDQASPPDGTEFAGGPTGIEGDMSAWGPQYPMGSQTIFGADMRWDLGLLGYLYAGYAYQMLKNSLTVDSAIESVHSFGGGNFNIGATDNYLESPFCKVQQGDPDYNTAPNDSCSNGTGNVGTALLQYELGLANFGFLPGNMDLRLKLYGMLNHITVDDIEVERLRSLYTSTPAGGQSNAYNLGDDVIQSMRQNGTIKYKWGADLELFPLDYMSFGVRFDRVNPTSNDHLKQYQGFSILSPRLVFRTQMVTHEEFSIQYSRYFYDQRQCVSEVNGVVTRVASPADDPFRVGGQAGNAGNSIYGGMNDATGLPLNLYCTQSPSGPRPPYGFGSHAVSQDAGNRGSPQLLPDENVIKVEASMWW